MREQMFKRVDTDGNGSVSKDELKTMLENRPKRADSTSQTLDTDEVFTKFDADGDGALSETELHEGMKSMRPSGPPPSSDFAGSSEMLDSILTTLSSSDEDGTTSLTDQQKEFIQQLVRQLKNSGTYDAQGSAGSAGSASLFGTTA